MDLIFALALVPISVVQASLFEWTFHRYWLHRPWLPKDCFTSHTLVHHQLCKFEDTFHVVDEEQHEALSFAWWGGPVLIAINVVPWALLGTLLHATGIMRPSPWLLLVPAGVIGIYYIGYEGLHYLMHKPTIGWLERGRYFKFIERHHRIHHIHMDRNLNVLLPLADFLLGTLVLEVPQTAGTSLGARKLARRHSTYGKRLREQDDSATRGAATESDADVAAGGR